jgi:hypothetical protein
LADQSFFFVLSEADDKTFFVIVKKFLSVEKKQFSWNIAQEKIGYNLCFWYSKLACFAFAPIYTFPLILIIVSGWRT